MIFRHPRIRHAGRVVSLTGVAVSLVGLLTATAGYSVGTLAGVATIKNAGGSADLNSGDSATNFTLRLPAGAACAGDSAKDGYRWQTYMVPVAVDPTTLTFGANGPLPPALGASFRQAFFATPGGTPVVNMLTAPADTAGGAGLILNIPDVDYSAFAPGDIPAGTYNVGVACTLGPAGAEQMKNFWNVQVTFVTAAAGGPAAVTWTVATTNLSTSSTVAGATTTSTTTAGATTTSTAGATTTSTAGATTTTTSEASTTTVGEASTTTGDETSTTAGWGYTGATTGGSPGQLSRTGGISTSLLFWAALLVIFGRMAVLFVRTPEPRSRTRR